MKYEEFKEQYLEDSNVKAEYDALEPEFQLIREMLNARNERHISQQELANITGIDRADISKLENGNANPSLKTMKRLAEGLGKKLEIRFV